MINPDKWEQQFILFGAGIFFAKLMYRWKHRVQTTSKLPNCHEKRVLALTLFPEQHLTVILHANLGGMYRESGNYIKAKEHMEAAITLLRQYDLLACHDSIPQVVNYALLLSEMGQPDKAIAVLEQVEKVVQEHMPCAWILPPSMKQWATPTS